jgi:protein AATF/BFR2
MRRIPLHGGMAAAAKPAKRRKVVDRRASKGRKLRYHVQQPLVNFCAPVDMEVPAWAEKVFGQLFASKE